MIIIHYYSLSASLSLSPESQSGSILSGLSPITVPVNKLLEKQWNWGGIASERNNCNKYFFNNEVTANVLEYAFRISKFVHKMKIVVFWGFLSQQPEKLLLNHTCTPS